MSYMLGELICNISQHSDGKYGYIFSQKALLKEKLLLLLKVPVLNFSNAYAQYRAVRDERAGLERQVRGV